MPETEVVSVRIKKEIKEELEKMGVNVGEEVKKSWRN